MRAGGGAARAARGAAGSCGAAGKKILISGGGRCNFTNIHARAENFLSENPHFAKSALARFTPADIIAMVERHGIRYHEKTLGQLFCDRSAMEVVTMLERECAEVGVQCDGWGARCLSVVRDGQFVVETTAGGFRADAVVIATGGLSIPKMGATGFGYEMARAVWAADCGVPAGAGAAGVQCGGSRAVVRSGGCVDRGGGVGRSARSGVAAFARRCW